MREDLYKDVCNELLDHFVIANGVTEAIEFLITHCNCTKEEICEGLGFDEDDYEKVVEK